MGQTLLTLAFLFAIGSLLGWVSELLFRRFFSAKRWLNPGFLVGPCLPLYGFGLSSLYLMSRIPIDFIKNEVVAKIVLIVFMALIVTLIEYVAGLIFIKGMKTQLWDYSKRPGNIQGIICPLFSFFWLIACAIYNLFLDKYVLNLTDWFTNNIAFSFFVGMFFGILIIDFSYSISLASKIRSYAAEHQIIVRWEQFKANIAEHMEEIKEKSHFVLPFHTRFSLKESLEHYYTTIKDSIESVKKKKNK